MAWGSSLTPTLRRTPSGNSFVRRMVALGRLVRERIRGGLHHGMKRALAVI
jgi:hypothetical protein